MASQTETKREYSLLFYPKPKNGEERGPGVEVPVRYQKVITYGEPKPEGKRGQRRRPPIERVEVHFVTRLPSGTVVEVHYTNGRGVVYKRAKVLGYRNVRMGADGQLIPVRLLGNQPPGRSKGSYILQVPIEIPEITLTVSNERGSLEARSCCKWNEKQGRFVCPDTFKKSDGIKLALSRLLHPEKASTAKERQHRELELKRILPKPEDIPALLMVCQARPGSPERRARRQERQKAKV